MRFRRTKEVEGDSFDADIAGHLMEASVTGQALGQFVPEPHWSEVQWAGAPDAAPTKDQLAVKRVEGLIWKRLRGGDSFSDLLLSGWVYQFWLKDQDSYPTVEKIAAVMGISRRTFYRRGYRAFQIKELYRGVCEPVRDQPSYLNVRGTIFEHGGSSHSGHCSTDDDSDDGCDSEF